MPYLLLAVLALVPSAGRAQTPVEGARCHVSDAPGTTLVRALPGSFTATVRRSSDATLVEDACTLSVVDGAGVEVFQREGFGVSVSAGTGLDLDGDGVPEAVLGTDSGGGNRCCWTYTVLRLGRVATPLADLGFAPVFLREARGFALQERQAFYDLGRSMAEAPTLVRIYRLEHGRLVERTPQYCDRLLARDEIEPARADLWPLLTPARKSAAAAGAAGTFEVDQTRMAAVSLALQLRVCGREREADALLGEVWRPSEAAAQRRRVAAALAASRPK